MNANEQPLHAALLDAWIDQNDPRHGPVSTQALGERRLAGVWVAWQRSRLGLSRADLAAQAGIDAHCLHLLELGVAGRDHADDGQWEQYCLRLADAEHSLERVAAIVSIAHGERVLGRGLAMEQVRRELRELYGDGDAEAQPEDMVGAASSPRASEEALASLRGSIFASLRADHLRLVSSRLLVEDFEPGAVIFQQGSRGDALYIIVEGEVQISIATRAGDDFPVERAGRGRSFGELALLDGHERSATVRALSATKALLLRRETFDAIGAARPEIYRYISQELARRLRTTNNYVEFFRDYSPSERLLMALRYLAARYGEHTQHMVRVDLSIFREELTRMSSNTPETIAGDVAWLQEMGVLEITPAHIRLNLRELERLPL